MRNLHLQNGGYRFTRQPFGVMSAGGMFQQKINKIFKDLPNLYGIADDIVIVEYKPDGRDHDRMLRQVMQICHQDNFTNKCHFRCTMIPSFGEVISREGVQLDSKEICL